MEKEIEKAIRETLVISNPQSINIAVKKILLLFSDRCQCDACKQDRIDSNYRKYIELNKNVIGYD